MGECKERRGVFPSGFPYHVEDICPSHIFTIIPTAGGEASTAASIGRRGEGGAIVRYSKRSTAVVRVRVRYHVGGS